MMEREVRMLLSQAAALDNRKVTDAMVVMWFKLFRPFSYAESNWALEHHATTSTEYLTPAHLVRIINWKRTEYAMSNPSRSHEPDAWVEFEEQMGLAAEQARQVRGSGKPYAVDVMDGYDMKEISG